MLLLQEHGPSKAASPIPSKMSDQRNTQLDHIENDEYDTGDLFGQDDLKQDEVAVIRGLKISVLEKSGLALTLLADHIFSPALVLSELIWENKMNVNDKRVLELGCGTGLVGLVALLHNASYVALTDYDDESILSCPKLNLSQNMAVLPSGRCEVLGHTWGSNTARLIKDGKFDVVVLADILWYTSSHHEILASVSQTLAPDGEVWISSGKYTTYALDFFTSAGEGWVWDPVELQQGYKMPDVHGVPNLDARKDNCLCWRMRRRS
ncbi:Nicotinamide n-methyltransferase [Taphrina deformans PYCC 5710]|uniref:Nicotinamide n-methyltransferase n=1 Tax=Taphrina deformans (strain PYCC 5710 / ATCC 11124 / CBS 356.35 / IMI 108563 / JCM 9778 / NBRC 8474) TaxID=1097556 RepID=R4X6E0_TAPDE|nr:Nicotinamide n-methyltransferase [Taphrina deformans PYCC 5710]|eukprot:CCG80610.1 Nicotinamide n-methyltransferase [Taphrina deformans PYCC 5710]